VLVLKRRPPVVPTSRLVDKLSRRKVVRRASDTPLRRFQGNLLASRRCLRPDDRQARSQARFSAVAAISSSSMTFVHAVIYYIIYIYIYNISGIAAGVWQPIGPSKYPVRSYCASCFSPRESHSLIELEDSVLPHLLGPEIPLAKGRANCSRPLGAAELAVRHR